MLIDYKKLILGSLVIIVVLLGLRQCDKKQIKTILDTRLSSTEQAAVIVDPHSGSVTVIRRDRKNKKDTTVVQTPVDGSRDVRISISPSGSVVVTARTKGFCFEPGLVGGWGHGARVGLDVQLAFYRRWGINVGVTSTSRFNIKLFVGGSYTLSHLHLSNTSILLGTDSQKTLFAGLRVRL